MEELCRDAPHLADRLREWTRVLKSGDWLNRRAEEVADETLGEAGVLTAEEKDRHRTLGEYDLLEELGGGGMGRVFKAVHRKMNRTVAVKLLPESLVQSAGVGGAIPAGSAGACPAFPPEHRRRPRCGRGGRHALLRHGPGRRRRPGTAGQGARPDAREQALDCILQAARGLEYAHAQGVVHRDVKPSNLILDRDGTVKILDLGIARFQPLPEQAGDDLTRTGCVLGTVDYMAPEQAMNTRRADHRADIYSLGCTLWFLLTGQPLYGGDTVMERLVAHREHPVPSLRKACPAAPEWLDRVFRKMVAKKPEDRYQSVTGVISDLAQRSAPRRRLSLRVAAAIVALLLLAGIPFVFHGGTTQEKTYGKRSGRIRPGETRSRSRFGCRQAPVFRGEQVGRGPAVACPGQRRPVEAAGDGGPEGERLASGAAEARRPLVGLRGRRGRGGMESVASGGRHTGIARRLLFRPAGKPRSRRG